MLWITYVISRLASAYPLYNLSHNLQNPHCGVQAIQRLVDLVNVIKKKKFEKCFYNCRLILDYFGSNIE